MFDKRPIVVSPFTLLFVIAILLMISFSFWLHVSCQTPWPVHEEEVPPKNVTEHPLSDESRLIDMTNFRFLMNHDICNKHRPLFVILVHSAPGNVRKRSVIRETWGRTTKDVALLFLLGADNNYTEKLKNEDQIHKDLIQGNFLDAYRNMTYKHVMALKWAVYNCPGVKYILKVDDDVFVHVLALMDFLKNDLMYNRRLIMCDLLPTAVVKRSWRSKWRVSPREYPAKWYPNYCAGWAILYSADSAYHLYHEAQREPYFWIDDVHITGTLAKKINITQTSMHSLILTKEKMRVILRDGVASTDFVFGPPDLLESDIRSLDSLVRVSA